MNLASGIEVAAGLIGGLVLALGGLVLEVFAIQRMLAGELIVGAWLVIFGAIVLYAGLSLIGRRSVLSIS